MSSDGRWLNERALILAPIGRDTELAAAALTEAGVHCTPCDSIEEMLHELQRGAGVLLITEEALSGASTKMLAAALANQPKWSELPVMIFTTQATFEMRMRSYEQLGPRANVTLIDRPIRVKTLISVTRSVLKSRLRQYELRDVMEALHERIKERDKFLAILGHELRNPLTAILFAVQTAETEQTEDLTRELSIIERQARGLWRIVDDLLEISRVTSGKIVLQKKVIDLREAVRSAVQAMGEVFREHELSVSVVNEGHEVVRCNVDPVRIEQVMTNLLTNAVKYTQRGGHITITVGCDDREARVSVRDSGVGIPREMLGRIFELFAQAQDTIDRAQGGMGIGLTLVRNVIELHGGSIEARSDGPGHGSEFLIRLPLAASEEISAAGRKPAQKALARGRYRIAVIEDNRDIRELLQLKLQKLGHEVKSASDGEEGLELLRTYRPDAALIDIGLPKLDGYALSRQLRSGGEDTIVLIALTGYGQPEDRQRASEAGFDEHLTKPVNVSDIQAILSDRLGNRAVDVSQERAGESPAQPERRAAR